MSHLDAFVRAVPKAELHLHLVGSATPAAVAALAARHHDSGVPTSVDALRRWFRFTDFAHFIDVYAQAASLVRSGDDIVTLIDGTAGELASQNVRYAEMTITPFTHLQAGVPYPELVEGLDDGRRRARQHGVELAWVFDVPGEMGAEAAETTADLAVHSPPDGLVAFGLGGMEAGVDRSDFAPQFQRAIAAGLKSVPHAGEADGPASIRAALDDLRADRIGHGVRAVEEPELLARLVDEQIPLEVCPSSNVCTGVFPSLADHPLPLLLHVGAFVTINTDDASMFSTTLNDEYLRIAEAFGLDVPDIARLVRNSIGASFMVDAAKATLLAEVDEIEAAHR